MCLLKRSHAVAAQYCSQNSRGIHDYCWTTNLKKNVKYLYVYLRHKIHFEKIRCGIVRLIKCYHIVVVELRLHECISEPNKNNFNSCLEEDKASIYYNANCTEGQTRNSALYGKIYIVEQNYTKFFWLIIWILCYFLAEITKLGTGHYLWRKNLILTKIGLRTC